MVGGKIISEHHGRRNDRSRKWTASRLVYSTYLCHDCMVSQGSELVVSSYLEHGEDEHVGLHIGQFNDSFRPVMDGVGVCMENYTYWIRQNHGPATAVVPRVPGYRDNSDYEVLRFRAVALPRMKPFRVGLPWLDPRFMKNLRDTHFDLVHAHCPFVSGRLARSISRRERVPMVATFHSKYRDDFHAATGSSSLAEIGVRYVIGFYSTAAHVWAPNKATAATLHDYGYRGPVEIVPNGTDLEVPSREEGARLAERGREAVGLRDSSVPMYLFVGQHRWEKNVELIFRTLGLLRRTGTDFHMVFAGTGYAENAMQRMCRAEGVTNQVTFLGLVLERERLKELYAAAHLLLFPSLYDNAPLVMREAAGFGVPTVLVRGASAAEGVVDGVNGFLTENNSQALAKLLTHLAEQPEHCERVGKGARRDIYLHWRDVVEQVYGRYEDIVATSSRRTMLVDREVPS